MVPQNILFSYIIETYMGLDFSIEDIKKLFFLLRSFKRIFNNIFVLNLYLVTKFFTIN